MREARFDGEAWAEAEDDGGEAGGALAEFLEDEEDRGGRHVSVGGEDIPGSVETPVARSRASLVAWRMRGPPGWTAQEATSLRRRPQDASQRSSHGLRCSRMSSGARAERYISKPWLPIFQLMASAVSGTTVDP